MTPNRRSRSSVALVAAAGALVLGGAVSAAAADLAPGVGKEGMFRDGGSFAQEVAPGEADLVSAAMSAVRAAAGTGPSQFAAGDAGPIAAAAALLGAAQEPAAGAFAGEAAGFDRLQAVGYGGEGGLMANSDLPRNAQPTNPARQRGPGRFADAGHPVLAAIATAKGWFGLDEASFAAPSGVGAYDAVREAAGDIGAQIDSGLMSGAAFAGTLEPAAIRAAAYVTEGRIGYSARVSGYLAALGSGDAAFAADADAGMATRLRQAAASIGAADGDFSASIGAGIATGEATGVLVDPGLRQPDLGITGDDVTEVMLGLLERGT